MAKTTAKKKQPRQNKNVCVIVDEYGDYGMPPKKNQNGLYRPTKSVGMGVSVLKNKKDFLEVYDMVKTRRPDMKELKGARIKNPDDRAYITEQIRKKGVKTYGYNIDKTKRDSPDFLKSAKTDNEKALKTLECTMEHVLDKRRMNGASILIDRHTAYVDSAKKDVNGRKIGNYDVANKIIQRVADKKHMKVKVYVRPSSNSKQDYGKLLQVNDFVTNSVYRHTERGDKSDTTAMRTKLKRLKR